LVYSFMNFEISSTVGSHFIKLRPNKVYLNSPDDPVFPTRQNLHFKRLHPQFEDRISC